MHVALMIYLAGVVVGLAKTDAGPLARLVVAVSWPLGPLAFVATIATLLATAAVVFPLVGLSAVAIAALAWWWMS